MLLFGVYLVRERVLNGLGDFAQLYIGASLAGSGHLFDLKTYDRRMAELLHVQLEAVYYNRLPYYALLLKPLTWLPYRAAFAAFVFGNFALVVWFLRRFDPGTRELFIIAAYSLPLAAALANGQDAPLLLALSGAGLVLMRQEKDLWAGGVFSLLSIKYHLFVLLPLLLWRWKKPRVLAGAIAGGVALFGLSFLAEGVNWIPQYISLIRNPAKANPCPGCMPNLHGAAFALAGESGMLPLEAVLAIAAVVLWWIAISRTAEFELAFALTIVAGILVSHHAYMTDCVLLLLPAALILRLAPGRLWTAAAALMTLPPVYLLVLGKEPYNAVLPGVLLALVALGTAAPAKKIPAA